jgi:hypothetical protein
LYIREIYFSQLWKSQFRQSLTLVRAGSASVLEAATLGGVDTVASGDLGRKEAAL